MQDIIRLDFKVAGDETPAPIELADLLYETMRDWDDEGWHLVDIRFDKFPDHKRQLRTEQRWADTLAEVQKREAFSTAQKEEAQRLIKHLEKRFDEKEAKLEEVESHRDDLLRQVEHLLVRIDDQHMIIREYNSETNSLTTEKSNLEGELDVARQENKRLANMVHYRSDEIAQLGVKLATETEARHKANKATDRREDELASALKKITRIEAKNRTLHKRIAAKEASRLDQELLIAKLRKQIKHLENELASRSWGSDEDLTELERITDDANLAVAQLNAKLDHIRTQR